VFERYLLSVLTQEAGSFVHNGLVEAFDLGDEEELLVPLYKGMAEEDAQFFEECRQKGALDANTDLIATAFKVEWVAAEVVEMSRRIAGDGRIAEIVERTKARLIKKNEQLVALPLNSLYGQTLESERGLYGQTGL
jgi:hypothetical protein